MDSGIILVFGVLLAIAVGSLLLFRRRHLSTRWRIVLSVLAVALLLTQQVRENPSLLGAVAVVGFAAVVLGAGIYYLWRAEKLPPS